MVEEIQIEPTSKCNLNCIMCNNAAKRRKGKDLSLTEFKAILSKFPNLRKIHLHGLGEPLLNPHIVELVKYAKRKGIIVVFNTNAQLLTKKLIKKLVVTGADEIRISFDAGTKSTYQKIKGADFDRLIAYSKIATKITKNTKTTIIATFVLLKENQNELSQLLSLLNKISINKLIVQNELTWGMNKRHSAHPALLRKEFEKAKKIATKLGIQLSLPPLKPKTGNNCIWPFSSSYISVDGSVMPCCVLSNPDKNTCMGNIFVSSFNEVWASDKYNEFRIKISSDNPPACCVHCPIYNGTFKDYETANKSKGKELVKSENMIIKELANNCVRQVKDDLLETMKGNIMMIVLIGSTNNELKMDTFSDVDLFIVIKEMNQRVLYDIAQIRDRNSNNIKVDIKVYTQQEWDKSHVLPNSLLNNWTKRMMISNKNKILYTNPDMKIKFSDNDFGIIIGAYYYIDKMKRYFMLEDVYLRGRIIFPSKNDFFKVMYSATFCVAKFALALNGRYVFTNQEIISEFKNEKTGKVLEKLYKARKKNNLDDELLKEALQISIKLYNKMLEKIQ